MMYNRVHTGPKSQDGGDHDGLISAWYQEYAFMTDTIHLYERSYGNGCALKLEKTPQGEVKLPIGRQAFSQDVDYFSTHIGNVKCTVVPFFT